MSETKQIETKNGHPVILHFNGEPLNLKQRILIYNLDLDSLKDLQTAVKERWVELSRTNTEDSNRDMIETCKNYLVDLHHAIEDKNRKITEDSQGREQTVITDPNVFKNWRDNILYFLRR